MRKWTRGPLSFLVAVPETFFLENQRAKPLKTMNINMVAQAWNHFAIL